MKKIFLTLILVLPLFANAQAITDGLVGYWPFNGNANDESGNGNDGVVSGATLTEDRFGNLNNAYSFDGVDDYINISNILTSLSTSATGTWSAWIKPHNVTTGTQYLISIGYTYQDQYIRIFINVDGKLSGNARIGATRWVLSTDNIVFSNNNWVHVAIIQDGSFPKFFVNGIAVEQTFQNEVAPTSWVKDISKDKMRIGDFSGTSGENGFLDGVIDEVMIYNRALTVEEIQLIYNNSAPTPQPIPVLCEAIYCDGQNIGIGTSNTQGYKLAVAGDIITEKIKVASQANWPDYVFQPEHQMPSLQELEQYIQENQKLPGMPSATEAETEGIDLGEMNRLLLEKIEMLTLYVIEQHKEIEKLKIENGELRKGQEKQNKEIEVLKLNIN